MRKSSPTQITETKVSSESRRRERRKREDEYRRRIDNLRRQIEEARRRRQRMLLLFLLAVLAMQESFLAALVRSRTYQPDYHPGPSGWTPSPARDYAPRNRHDDHCDGYSHEEWTRMLDERGINLSRKAEIRAEWHADPERELFPERYQLWGHRPYIGQIIDELKAEYWRADAFAALKLLTPTEVHTYLDEGYAAGSTFRRCLADRDADIIANFRSHALLWEERKRYESEEARKAKDDKKPDEDEKKFEP